MFAFFRFVFDLLVGIDAGTLSAVLGLFGGLAFAKAPMESLRARRAIFQLLALTDALSKAALESARHALVREAEEPFESERKWNMRGAVLLSLSFAILIGNSVYSWSIHHSAPTAQTIKP
jgi:hypothetical protein